MAKMLEVLKALFRIIWRVQTLVIALVIFPMVAVGVVTGYRLYKENTRSALLENRSEAFLIANVVKERLVMLLEFGASISQRPSLAAYLKNGQWTDAIESIEDVPLGFEYIDRIFLVDTNGVIRVQTPDKPKYLGLDRSDTDWFSGVSRGWKPYLSEVYPDPVQPERSIIAVVLPVFDPETGKVIGILLFHAPVKIFADLKIQESVSDAGGFFYLVDNQGSIVYHPRLPSTSNSTDFRSVPAVQKILEGKRGSEVNYNPIEKEKRLVTYDIVPQFGWGVVIVKPYATAFIERDANLRNFIFIYSLILILSFVVVYLILRVLRERSRMDMLKDEFISTVSHEMRNPLFGIRESVAQISEGILGPVNKEQNEFLAIALNSIDRLGRIINDLLDVAKIEARKMVLQLGWCDPAGIAARTAAALQFQAKSKGVEIRTHLPGDLPDILADADRIEQIFFNLISNAVKFTSSGTIDVTVVDRKDMIECCVADTGAGILRVQLKDIFAKEKKYTSVNRQRGKGTGLGLFITKEIVDLHGGKIWIKSEPGRGTTVTFTLPKYAQEEAARKYLDSMRQTAKTKQPLFLLMIAVEDFDGIRERLDGGRLDAVRRRLERCINTNIRRITGDVVLGGEAHYLVVLPQADGEQADGIAGRIRQECGHCTGEAAGGHKIDITVSKIEYPHVAEHDKALFSGIANIISLSKTH